MTKITTVTRHQIQIYCGNSSCGELSLPPPFRQDRFGYGSASEPASCHKSFWESVAPTMFNDCLPSFTITRSVDYDPSLTIIQLSFIRSAIHFLRLSVPDYFNPRTLTGSRAGNIDNLSEVSKTCPSNGRRTATTIMEIINKR